MRSMSRFLAALAALLLAAAASAQQTAPRQVAAQQVSPSAWFVQGDAALGSRANRNFISNAGFIVTPAGVVVIDALGSPQLAKELLDEIARVTPQPVTHVIVTHYHADHVYGLQEFRRRGGQEQRRERREEPGHGAHGSAGPGVSPSHPTRSRSACRRPGTA